MGIQNEGWYAKRWVVLARDEFTCQYCGRSAPDVILHVDHKVPRAVGGTDDLENLHTACAACNIGRNLSVWKPEVVQRRERGDQLKPRIIRVLHSVDKATATEICREIDAPRASVVSVLTANTIFERKGRIGRKMFWGLTDEARALKPKPSVLDTSRFFDDEDEE